MSWPDWVRKAANPLIALNHSRDMLGSALALRYFLVLYASGGAVHESQEGFAFWWRASDHQLGKFRDGVSGWQGTKYKGVRYTSNNNGQRRDEFRYMYLVVIKKIFTA